MADNTLYYDDNLDILRQHMADESVDLIYLDPPFNSNRSYNVLFREAGEDIESDAQIAAFKDTWQWDAGTQATLHEIARTCPPNLVDMMNSLVDFMGRNEMTAYLVMMAIRMVELHRVLRPNGALFLHCDTTAGHYLKILLDQVFGKDKLVNQIIWKRTAPKGHAYTRAARSHDIILWYAKGKKWTYNRQYTAYDQEYLDAAYRHVEEGSGRRYRLSDTQNPNKNRPNLTYEWNGVVRVWRWTKEKMQQMHDDGRLIYSRSGLASYKRYLDEMPGAPLTDVWTDISPVGANSKERLGYPTQKPLALLERIIEMASNEGDIVLDPFCGCGTAIVVAEKLDRPWSGIDITHLAITLIEKRLEDAYPECAFKVVGRPEDEAGARALADQNRYQFEYWALSLVNARPASGKKKGADTGVDGVLFFVDNPKEKAKKVIVQVKSGKVNVAQIRDFARVIERDKAVIGLFLTLESPTNPMLVEATALGVYEPALQTLGAKTYPRLQILTIDELLAAGQAELPTAQVTYKTAERTHKNKQSDFLGQIEGDES